MNYEIKPISWDTIFNVWRTDLWPTRSSPIESNSAMRFGGGYDGENMSYPPTFFGVFTVDGNLVGVNSGHKCLGDNYRSRGLWVNQIHRGKGLGQLLLNAAIEQGKYEGCSFVWSLPKFTSKKTYEAVGFKIVGDWFSTDTSDRNSYCVLYYK